MFIKYSMVADNKHFQNFLKADRIDIGFSLSGNTRWVIRNAKIAIYWQ